MSHRATSTLSTNRYQEYKLYAVNFHTNSLNSILYEFKKRVETGIRRRVFIIDIEEEAKQLALKVRNTKRFDNYSVTMSAIERCLAEYKRTSRIIADEKKFSLIDFWLENLNVPTGLFKQQQAAHHPQRKSSKKLQPKTPTKSPTRMTRKGSKFAMAKKKSVMTFASCPQLMPKAHNRVGRPAPLSKKRYIEDEPEFSKIFIILIGDMDNEFYVKLLSANQPLQAIVHFLPEESAYDLLIPHPETKQLIASTIEEIQVDIFEMRALALTKPAGYMQHYLPVISRCLAEKYTHQIYDQLSHYLYDIELLLDQYEKYYLEPFHIIDVEMPLTVQVEGLREVAESLALQGSYLRVPLPAIASDLATVAIYFEGLLNQIAQRLRKLTPQQAQLSTLPYKQASAIDLNQDLRDVYATAFDSILKVKHFERICVAANNLLLHELLLYTDVSSFETIHYTSLEYNSIRAYVDNACMKRSFKIQLFDDLSERDFFQLPFYAKLYFGENTVKQHLQLCLAEYSVCEVDEITPGSKLYHFKRAYNEVNEEQQVVVLPSPLCFRDFTLFQMEEFLEALITPEMIRQYERNFTTMSFLKQSKRDKDIQGLDLSIFIRPTSLKWKKILAYMEARMTQGSNPTLLPQLKSTELSLRPNPSNLESKPGLPVNHHLLQGYNLENVRQEIQIKSSKYFFEEGGLELYEERWCFTDMNKNLLFKVNDILFNIFRPRFWNTSISPNLRFTNKNNVSVRILNTVEECSKVVINYPNGLAIYHNETQVQQEWYTVDTVNSEKRRVFVPEGAVIVYYQGEDLITVLRYNGEIYRLYQYEFVEGEEEAFNETTEDLDSSIKIEQRDSTATRRTQRDSKKVSIATQDKSKDRLKEDSKEKSKSRENNTRKSTARSKSSQRSIVLEKRVKPKTPKQLLIESIDNELRFLNELTNKYGLKYLHLIVTTSMGLIVNLTHRGKAYRGHTAPTLEWHDYFMNESYAQRGDGVRMIWTADALKCYHDDGTLFVTRMEENVELFTFNTDTGITVSSSHIEEEYTAEVSDLLLASFAFLISAVKMLIRFFYLQMSQILKDVQDSKSSTPIDQQKQNSPYTRATTSHKTVKKSGEIEESQLNSTSTRSKTYSNMSHYFVSGEAEEAGKSDDPAYVTTRHASFQMIHKKYAEVLIELYEVPINDIVISINAIDGISTFIYKVLPVIENIHLDYTDYTELPRFGATIGDSIVGSTIRRTIQTTKIGSIHTEGSDLHASVDGNTVEQEVLVQTVVKVSFGSALKISTTEDACELAMELQRYEVDNAKVRDKLDIRFDYQKNITDLFQYFIDRISNFKNYQKPKSSEFYFLEHQNEHCHVTGYRFLCNLPPPLEYNFSAGNTFTELRKLKNIDELMTNEYPWFDNDMKKFPRFPLKRERVPPINETFPLVLLSK
ncbi:unnamed protein product [Ceratitis capitata]|uniref:(Mediterranean fruit fly) hypothetical protein n=1 Tax=Ceratitis capitata TaxID=7213 RepID=A0A811V5D6_CERCA|nr:unnamed protein product [Ceratitis capitata]